MYIQTPNVIARKPSPVAWLTPEQQRMLHHSSNSIMFQVAESLLARGMCAPSPHLELLEFQRSTGGQQNQHTNDSNDVKRQRLLYDIMKYTSDVVYDPETGERRQAVVLTGLCYVQFLDKFANQQFKARASGALDSVTRQPIHKDKQKINGSTRVGYMEKDAMIQAGAYGAIHDRFYLNSDVVHVWFCSLCEQIALYDHRTQEAFCVVCKTSLNIKKIQTVFGSMILDYLQRWQGQKNTYTISPLPLDSIALIRDDIVKRQVTAKTLSAEGEKNQKVTTTCTDPN
jgi:hypothetical protein